MPQNTLTLLSVSAVLEIYHVSCVIIADMILTRSQQPSHIYSIYMFLICLCCFILLMHHVGFTFI